MNFHGLATANLHHYSNFSFVFSLSCMEHDECLRELRTFTHADEFHIYTSKEEIEDACSEARNAYQCVMSTPECRHSSDMAVLSPLLKGSRKLLNEFCGYKSRRRPCCALKDAYLEYSDCYEETSDMLNECNDKFRTSLEMIQGMKEETEQKEQRFCSLKWLSKCVKKATQNYCGKVATQVIRSYVAKAVQHHKAFITKTEDCHDILYGYEKVSDTLCKQKNFDKCQVPFSFLHEQLTKDRLTDKETFLSLCAGFHNSFECLNRASQRCLFNKQGKKFEKIHEYEDKRERNEICSVKNVFLKSYMEDINCLVNNLQHLEECKTDFETPAKYTSHTMPFHYYYQYFCGLISRYEKCLVKVSREACGSASGEIMQNVIQMAALNLHRKCNV